MNPTRRSAFKVIPAVLAGSLAIPSVAKADESVNAATIDEQGIADGMTYIESIPDAALQSEASFEKWQEEDPVVTPQGALGCGIAITTAVASNILAISKILKIKAAIKAAGGAKKFADLAITGFKVAKAEGMSNSAAIKFAAKEAAAGSGSDVVAAVAEVLTLSAVAEKCFGVEL